MVGGSDHNLIKLGFEETIQKDMDSLKGEDRDYEIKRPECLSEAQSRCEVMDLGPR